MRKSRVWKIVRHGSPEQWEETILDKSLSQGDLAMRLGQLAMSHLKPAAPTRRHDDFRSTSFTVKNDRYGNKTFTVYASGSRIYYVATLKAETSPTKVIL